MLSLLALPGALYSTLLFEKYSTLLLWMRGQHNFDPVTATVPDEYFFIVLSMVVTGAVAVWRWDSIFPDRRDYVNLVPLPISTRVIFLANLTAILFSRACSQLTSMPLRPCCIPWLLARDKRRFGMLPKLPECTC